MDYALIVGQGRSGTNWLLETLDHSARTFARNEPEGISDSPLASLVGDGVSVPTASDFGERWNFAVSWASSVMGERDHRIRAPKSYVFDWSRRLGGAKIASSPRFRRGIGMVLPSHRSAEWPLPRWLGSSKRLSEAVAVLKVNHVGWVRWILRERPTIPVLHIVRHPGGFLNSWTNRYLKANDAARVRAENAARLETIAAEDGQWSGRFGDIDRMSVEESELWYWLFSAETTYRAGQGCEQYHSFVYEHVAENAPLHARRAYAACGLEWTPYVEAKILQGGANSQAIAGRWRDHLAAEQRELVERILDQALIPSWWSD